MALSRVLSPEGLPYHEGPSRSAGWTSHRGPDPTCSRRCSCTKTGARSDDLCRSHRGLGGWRKIMPLGWQERPAAARFGVGPGEGVGNFGRGRKFWGGEGSRTPGGGPSRRVGTLVGRGATEVRPQAPSDNTSRNPSANPLRNPLGNAFPPRPLTPEASHATPAAWAGDSLGSCWTRETPPGRPPW